MLCTKAMSKKVEKIAGEVNMNLMELNFYLLGNLLLNSTMFTEILTIIIIILL